MYTKSKGEIEDSATFVEIKFYLCNLSRVQHFIIGIAQLDNLELTIR